MRFVLVYIILQIILVSAIEETNTQQSSGANMDLSVMVHDFGRNGTNGPIAIPLRQGVRPGTVISVVANTSSAEGTINILNDINLITFYVSINKTVLHVDSWGDTEKPTIFSNLVEKGSLFTTTLMYEEDGYRVFINGKFIIFYKHRISIDAHLAANMLEIKHNQVHKVVYMSIVDA